MTTTDENGRRYHNYRSGAYVIVGHGFLSVHEVL